MREAEKCCRERGIAFVNGIEASAYVGGKVKLAHNVVENEHGILARKLFENFHLGKLYGQRRPGQRLKNGFSTSFQTITSAISV